MTTGMLGRRCVVRKWTEYKQFRFKFSGMTVIAYGNVPKPAVWVAGLFRWRRWSVDWNPMWPAEYPPLVSGRAATRRGAKKQANILGRKFYYGAKPPYQSISIRKEGRNER